MLHHINREFTCPAQMAYIVGFFVCSFVCFGLNPTYVIPSLLLSTVLLLFNSMKSLLYIWNHMALSNPTEKQSWVKRRKKLLQI